ncbi:MAG: right-handed parallel beta-helix repeat-containing protein [Tepidisphaeraceae bacterium]
MNSRTRFNRSSVLRNASHVDTLETRRLMATFAVTNANDAGAGSLRDAITQANATPGADQVSFNIGAGSKKIALQTALPAISEALTIDGFTQPGTLFVPTVEVNGSGGGGLFYSGFIATVPITVRGLSLTGFKSNGQADTGHAVLLKPGSDGSTIEGNYIGVTPGVQAVANGGHGVEIRSANNVVRGNVISNNTGGGIFITTDTADNNTIEGNRIGTSPNGVIAMPNFGPGVELTLGASGNRIGGNTVEKRNLISGNQGIGVSINGSTNLPTSDNVVTGNWIGLAGNGVTAMGNTGGIGVYGGTGNIIGGWTSEERNVIAASTFNGITLDQNRADNTVIKGNYIGTTSDGLQARPNQQYAVSFSGGAKNAVLGGTNAGEGNLIVGMGTSSTVHIVTGSNNIKVQGNQIGLLADNVTAVADTKAIEVDGAGSGIEIGGATAGAGNRIVGADAGVRAEYVEPARASQHDGLGPR